MTVEAFAIPVVLRAVDFLFGEAKSMLAERRIGRRKENQAPPPAPIPLLDQDKQAILKRKVSDELAREQERALEGLLEEIEIYQKNLQHLRKQAALNGGLAFAPIHVVRQMEVQEDAILDCSRQMADIIGKLTGA
jgi:hypothetical protein